MVPTTPLKVTLIEPKPPERHTFDAARLPRLGLVNMATELRHRGYEANVWCQAWSMPSLTDLLSTDLVGISTTTSTAPEAYRLADMMRRHGIPVVLGGPHVTFLPDEGLEHADFVIRGEADLSFPGFVDALLRESGDPYATPGLSYRKGGPAVHNPLDGATVDIDRLPIPNLALVRPGWSRWRTFPVMTSRGCPHGCTFCGVTAMFGRRYRFRSKELVLEELSRLRGRKVFFYDDNFTANPGRTKELLEGMLSTSARPSAWGAQVRVDAARDPELLRLMARSGCRRVYVGFESINPETLRSFHKGQGLEDIRTAISAFHRAGIGVYGMFILGADADDARTPGLTVDFALAEGLEGAQFMILTPLPGTGLFSQLEERGRLLTRDWALYDGHNAVFQPAGLSPAELEAAAARAHLAFYSAKGMGRAMAAGNFRAAYQRALARVELGRWLRAAKTMAAMAATARVWAAARARLNVERLDTAAVRRLKREVNNLFRAGRRQLEIHIASRAAVAQTKALVRLARFLDRIGRIPGVKVRLTGLNAMAENLILAALAHAPSFEVLPQKA